MAEYTNGALQLVAAGQNVVFTESPVPCNRGYINHRKGSGVFTLRGITNQCRALYKVSYGGNISIPAGGTVGPISVAIAIDGEALASATAIVTPAAVDEFFSVYRDVLIEAPRGSSVSVSIKNISAQTINVQNSHIIIERVA